MRFLLLLIVTLSLLLNVHFFGSNLIALAKKSILKNKIELIEKDIKKSQAEHVLKEQYIFEVVPTLKRRIQFWESVYSKYNSNMVILHDSKDLSLIYEVIDFNYLVKKNYRPVYREIIQKRLILRARAKIIKALKKIENLKNLKRLNRWQLNRFERRIYAKIRKAKRFNIKNSYKRVRTQRGQRDMVKLALLRSAPYYEEMEKLFIKNRIPKQMVLLSFVESSFNIKAKSSAGAAGVWQIMPRVGKKLMTISYNIDERKDPIKSTMTAIYLLKESYKKLKNWPLVITSYNVGWPRIKKVLKRSGGKNITDLINQRYSRRIGFAAKNYYAEFIAMLNVYNNKEIHFPNLKLDKNKIKYKEMIVKYDAKLKDILLGVDVPLNEFKSMNPEFKKSILVSKTKIPRGIIIKLPL